MFPASESLNHAAWYILDVLDFELFTFVLSIYINSIPGLLIKTSTLVLKHMLLTKTGEKRIEWISIFPSFEQIFRKKLDLYCVGDISLFDQQFENQVSWEYPVCIAFHVSVFNHYFNSDLRIYASEKLEKRKQLIWGISSFHILYKDSQRKTRFVLRVINVSTPQ